MLPAESAAVSIDPPALNVDLPEPDASERAHEARLAAALRAEIAQAGPLPFPRFMERCLYAPGLGYYSAGRAKFGAAGDFVTAPELGALFARSLARAMAPTLAACGNGAVWFELGGGSGAFARDALRELAILGSLPHRYRILEPSADLRDRQRRCLGSELAPELFALVEWLDGPPAEPWFGVVFANEVLDALPVTRFARREGSVYEQFVALDAADGNFTFVEQPADALVAGAVHNIERSLGAPLPEGYRSEVLPQLPWWLDAVAGPLERGAVLFVDYGYPRRAYYLPERNDGTLICHYRHRAHGNPLVLPGLQDISASVDFTALAEAGHAAGFTLASYAPQSHFLFAAGLDRVFEDAYATAGSEAERYALANEVKRLTLPGEMGERFQAMVLTRGLDDAMDCFAPLVAADRSERL